MQNHVMPARRSVQELDIFFSSFLLSSVPEGTPIMLGYSGGPDSEALMRMYLTSSLREKFPLHLVHVDHGWRKESRQEAFDLQEKAEKLRLPFHLGVLDPANAVGNLENWSRKERYAFFQKVGKTIGTRWLLLGHHKDDSVEVVLRRLLDGSHFIHAAGIPFRSTHGSLELLRPLVFFEKEELLSYLQTKGISYIHDSTNDDVRFQRAAMRKVLFPSISKLLEKDIKSSLHRLSTEASFLKEHVEEELEKRFHWMHAPRAIMCTKKHGESHSSFLLMQSLHFACNTLGCSLSREQEMKAVEILRSPRSYSKVFGMKKTSLYVEQNSFLVLKREPLKLLPPSFSLEQEGVFTVGSWTISLAKEAKEEQQANSFCDLFLGGFQCAVEKLPLQVVASNEKNLRFCSRHKSAGVPASLRKQIPLFLQEGKAIAAPCCGWQKRVEGRQRPFVITVTLDDSHDQSEEA